MKPLEFLEGRGSKSHYRIGDAVLYRNDAATVVIREPFQTLFYKNTILNRYIRECSQEEKNIDIEKLRRITLAIGEENKWEKPRKGKCVVHLRVGDSKRITTDEVKRIIKRLKKIKAKSVTFVSFYHDATSVDDNVRTRTLEENEQTIQQLEDHCDEIGVKVNWKSSSNPDEDFYYLINADTLITTNGGFSIVAALTNPTFDSENFLGCSSDCQLYHFYAKGGQYLKHVRI